jgi:hypothetical protein
VQRAKVQVLNACGSFWRKLVVEAYGFGSRKENCVFVRFLEI